MNSLFVVHVPFTRQNASSWSVPLTFVIEAESSLEAASKIDKAHPHLLDYGFTVTPAQ